MPAPMDDQISKYLQDPLSFPPEFRSWFVKYLEQHQPSLQAGLLAGKLPTSKLTGQIPYSQLTLANSIVSGDIVDGTLVNADINAAAAIGIAKLADPTTGKVIGSVANAAAAVFPPGYRFAYTAATANVTVSATTEATATSVVSAGPVTFDGATEVCIEFYAANVATAAAAGAAVVFCLYDGTSIGFFGQVLTPAAAALTAPVLLRRFLTPTSGSHTYSVRAFQAGGNGTVTAGAGGAAAWEPIYIRITQA